MAKYTYQLLVGVFLSLNFVVFWSIPIFIQGMLWKYVVKYPALPIYNFLDKNRALRWFAETFIYTNPRHADFFAITICLVINYVGALFLLFRQQILYGHLPWYYVAAYYFAWVGAGGRMMGGAYALSHKEGHNLALYKSYIRKFIGHPFENVIGCFVGNVPWNFTTSHIFMHHKLDGGVGDSFYMWDINRASLHDFMLYLHRILLHMTGYSSLKYFKENNQQTRYSLLKKGVISYWLVAAAILVITRSPSFVFWVYLQPFTCMTYFLALLNIGFHGFIEYDADGKSVEVVNSTCIIGGEDDYFGEDDHMAHHYYTGVYFADLPEHQKKMIPEFKQHHASVFQKKSILEISIFVLFGLWDELADCYVDYTGKMTKKEIAEMLKARATRLETTYDEYMEYLKNPTAERRKSLTTGVIAEAKAARAGGKKLD